jgi:transcriptional regulator with XRE-family HTH domain
MISSSATTEFDSYLKAIGRTIRELRKELGFSQEELAHRSSIDRSHMGKIERGERNVSVVNVIRISKALHCAPSELLLRAGI